MPPGLRVTVRVRPLQTVYHSLYTMQRMVHKSHPHFSEIPVNAPAFLHQRAPEHLPRGTKPGIPKQRGLLMRFVDEQQSRGRYVVTGADLAPLGLSPSAQAAALDRLVQNGRLAKIGYRRGVWVIVPPEHQAMGGPPAIWVLHDLGIPYYVALRSAAEWYGATHYALQVLQVMVARRLQPMRIGRQRVRFILRADLDAVPTRMVPGQVAPLRCSTPEATALDLVRFMSAAGGLTAVAGALQQMQAQIATTGLQQALSAIGDAPNTQRLGYLLATIGHRRGAVVCERWLRTHATRVVRLEHGAHAAEPTPATPTDQQWKLLINAEPDLSL